MHRFTWWHVAVGATILALAAIVLPPALDGQPVRTIGPWVCLAVLGVAYVTFGWRSFAGGYQSMDASSVATPAHPFPALPFPALAFPSVAIACTAVGTAFNPQMATLQVIAFPIIWFTVDPLRRAVTLNIVLGLTVALGFVISTGASVDAVVQAVVIELISVLFSIALGLWFSYALEQGQQNTVLLDELRAAQDQLALAHRDSGVVAERERMAGEIHDTIAQSLTGLVMVAQRSRSSVPADQPALASDLALIEDIARAALVETRSLVAAAAPVDVDGGLVAALGRLATRFTRETGVAICVSGEGYVAEANDVEVVLLRCAQEALANVRKHSGATEAGIRVLTVVGLTDGEAGAAPDASPVVELTVTDNGTGLTAADPFESGFGLSGMRQRLSLVGGSLRLEAAPAGGVALVVALPSGRAVNAQVPA